MDSEEGNELDYSQFYQGTDEWSELANNIPSKLEERYQNSELIASGGMKEIFKVYDSKTCRHIAMAQLRKDVSGDYCESFLKEAYLTASMEHPNIISVYDIGLQEDSEPYFTMELKVGHSLSSFMKKENVLLNNLLEIFLKICDAISYAHSCGNLHLDIKPDNIQVGTFGEVQVCDWGLGCKIEEAQEYTKGFIKGTPGYMAPEQGKAEGGINCQTDIYALGALLYSLLTGKTPVPGGVNTVISKTINGRLEFPLERFPDKKIPESLDAVVRKAMAYEKEDRYTSADQLKNEVNKFLTGYSTEAENAGFMKEFSLFYQRNKSICLVAITALFFIAIGSSVFMFKLQDSKDATETALNDLTQSHEELKLSQEKERAAFKLSEENFRKYQEQKEEQLKVSLELQTKQYEKAHEAALYPVYFSDPIGSMETSLNLLVEQYKKSESNSLAQLIIKNLFICQKFDEIAQYTANDSKPLADLADDYKSFQRLESGELKDEHFLRVLRDLNALPEEERRFRCSMMERMIYYQMALKKTYFTSPEVLVELIKCWNPGWDASQMSYDRKRLNLALSGRALKKMRATARHSSKLCFFRLLKIDSLSVEGTGALNMYQFIGVNVKHLDIRDTAISSLTPHSSLKGVVKLIISEGQLDRQEQKAAPKSVKILIR